MANRVDAGDWVRLLIEQRQTLLPKRLGAPGPDTAQTDAILAAAGHAPDHQRLLPWRLVRVGDAARPALADAFAAALLERDPAAEPNQIEQAREKAFRSPLLLLAVLRSAHAGEGDGLADADTEVPDDERLIALGAALQNMLLTATALGLGSALTSGKALQSAAIRTLFQLAPHERAVCFVNVGSVQKAKAPRVRPLPGDYVSEL